MAMSSHRGLSRAVVFASPRATRPAVSSLLISSCRYPPSAPLCRQQQSRSFFGIGEIAGVLANPAETLRQLNESKDMLVKAREDAKLKSEKQRIPKKHTFAPLPGFHGRKHEQELLRKILAGNPQLNVLYGATSVGKTALLRQVLASDDDFYVIKFDLRISGFGDLRSLYIALCQQFRSVFEEVLVLIDFAMMMLVD